MIITSLLFLVAPAFAADFTVDPVHSHVGFKTQHFTGLVPGKFKDFEGKFSFDEKHPEAAQVEFTIKAASVDTGNPKRDGHLQSPDFFDAQKNPTLHFKSKKLSADGDKKFKLEGELTMRGVTKPATFDVEYRGTTKDMKGKPVTGFTAKAKVNRKDFGINWNKALDKGGFVLADEVEIELNVEGNAK